MYRERKGVLSFYNRIIHYRGLWGTIGLILYMEIEEIGLSHTQSIGNISPSNDKGSSLDRGLYASKTDF